MIEDKIITKLLKDDQLISDFNPKYALENLFRNETSSKQDASLTCFNSP